MRLYQITSIDGVDMGIWAASSPKEALNNMAREAGYDDQVQAEEATGKPFSGTVTETEGQ